MHRPGKCSSKLARPHAGCRRFGATDDCGRCRWLECPISRLGTPLAVGADLHGRRRPASREVPSNVAV